MVPLTSPRTYVLTLRSSLFWYCVNSAPLRTLPVLTCAIPLHFRTFSCFAMTCPAPEQPVYACAPVYPHIPDTPDCLHYRERQKQTEKDSQSDHDIVQLQLKERSHVYEQCFGRTSQKGEGETSSCEAKTWKTDSHTSHSMDCECKKLCGTTALLVFFLSWTTQNLVSV